MNDFNKKEPLTRDRIKYNRPHYPRLYRESNIEQTLLMNLSMTADTLLELLGRVTENNYDGIHIELRKVRKRRVLAEKLQNISHEIDKLFYLGRAKDYHL